MAEEIQKINKLVAIYGRVSTSNQEDEGTIESQLLAVRDYAKKNGYIIVKEYLDDGWSGDTLIRPELDRLRMEAKQKMWEAVLIYDPDRLARRYSYQELVMDELKEAGRELIFITIPTPKNPEEKVMYGMRGLFSEWERVKITERFRLGKLRKAREGHIVGHEAPYGYTYIKKTDKELGYYVINEEEVRIVKMIYNWVAIEKLTIRAIARRLMELGIKPRENKDGVWNTSTLGTMLTRKTYIGDSYYLKSYSVIPENPIKKEVYKKIKKTSRKIRPEEEWIKIPVEPIMGKELFEKVQVILKENYNLCKRNRKNEYLLAGKIYCACGKRRTGEGSENSKHLYYRCIDRTLRHPLPKICNEKGVNAKLADRLVWNKLVSLTTSKELLQKQMSRWLKRKQNKVKFCDGDLGIMIKDIKKLKDQEDRYNRAYGAGVFTIEKLKEYTEPIAEKINSLEKQIAQSKQEQNNAIISLPEESVINLFTERMKKVINKFDFEEKRGLIMRAITNIIGTKTELKVAGFIPIYEQNAEFKTKYRNCGIAKCWEIHIV